MRVLLIDDHALFRAGIGLLLRELHPTIEILEAGRMSDGLELARVEPLNLVFLDLALPDGHGFDALRVMKTERPALPVVVMTALEDRDTVNTAIDLHAMGFVPKSQGPQALNAALQSALVGGVFLPSSIFDRGNLTANHDNWSAPMVHGTDGSSGQPCASLPPPPTTTGLTPRESETLRWLIRGLPNKSIASKMQVEDITVRKYVSHLLAHFNVKRRTELIVYCAKNGIISGPPMRDTPARGIAPM